MINKDKLIIQEDLQSFRINQKDMVVKVYAKDGNDMKETEFQSWNNDLLQSHIQRKYLG